MMSQLLQLKLTNLNPTVLKCGFPVNSLEKYMPLLEQTGKTIEIIDLEKNSSSSIFGITLYFFDVDKKFP